MQESIVFLLRVQCRRKESSRSLSHLLMSFLSYIRVLKCSDMETVVLHLYELISVNVTFVHHCEY